MPADLASAARRAAYRLREGAWPHLADLLALLPVLDAVARSGGDRINDTMSHAARRVLLDMRNLERPNFGDLGLVRPSQGGARAAIALADAARVAERGVRPTEATR